MSSLFALPGSGCAPGPGAAQRATTAHTHAEHLIAQARQVGCGQVDTRQLAHWVTDAAQRDPQAASHAYAAIEQQLGVADAGRFSQDVVAQARLQQQVQAPATGTGPALTGQWATGQVLAQRGDHLLINNPILHKEWSFFESAVTGKGGPSGPLAELLSQHNIPFNITPHPVAAGSIGPAAASQQGLSLLQMNGHNGSMARDHVQADALRHGHAARTEVTTQGGARRVDVVIDHPARDPRDAVRREVEVKTGRANQTETHVRQVSRDVEALADNRALRQTGELMGKAGRVVRPLGMVMDAVAIGTAFQADGHRIGEHTGRAVSGLAGAGAGAWGGASVGAAIGTAIFPGVGTVMGGVIGGVVGGLAGDAAGKGLFDTVKSWF